MVVVSEACAYARSNCSVGKGQREVLVWYDLPASIASVLQFFFHVGGDNIVGICVSMCSCSGSKNFAWLLDLHKSVWVATVDVIWRLLFLQRLSHIGRELSTSGAMTESQELFPAGGPGWDNFFLKPYSWIEMRVKL